MIVAGVELLYAGLEGKLLLPKVPGLGVQVIAVGPVVMEMVSHTAVDGGDGLHVATTPATAKVTRLHLQRGWTVRVRRGWVREGGMRGREEETGGVEEEGGREGGQMACHR